MTKIDDGGPAFPACNEANNNGTMGMTLLDAATLAALPAIITVCAQDTPLPGETKPQMFARKSREVARAMLAARKDRPHD